MQPERQVSVACAAVGAALVFPAYAAFSRHQPLPSTGVLVTGAVLGAVGVLLGSLLAADHSARVARALGFSLWALIGLAFAGALALALISHSGWGHRVLLGITTVLPLAGPVLVLARGDSGLR